MAFKKGFLYVLVGWMLCLPLHAQLRLTAGNIWAVAGTIPYSNLFFGAIFTNPASVTLEFQPGTFTAGALLRIEMFEDSVSDVPIATTVLSNASPFTLIVPYAWPDFQGATKLSMLAGSAVVSQITLKRLWYRGSGLISNYEWTFVPTTPPSLSIVGQGAGQVRLFWPTNDDAWAFRLECALQIPATNWFPVTNGLQIVQSNYAVTIPTSSGTRFYRLTKP